MSRRKGARGYLGEDVCVCTRDTKKDRPEVPVLIGRDGFTHHGYGAPSGTRTRDTLIKSQVLYQLS